MRARISMRALKTNHSAHSVATVIDTKAKRALIKLLVGERTQAWLAAKVGKRQSAVSRWINGSSRPEGYMREALEIVLGIPPADWLTAKEAQLLEQLRAERAANDRASD